MLPLLLLIGGGVGVAVMLGLFSSEPPANIDEEQTQVEEVVAPTVQTTFLKYGFDSQLKYKWQKICFEN